MNIEQLDNEVETSFVSEFITDSELESRSISELESDSIEESVSRESLDKEDEYDHEIKVGLWDFCQCDTSKCSGRKLIRFKYAKKLHYKNNYKRKWSGIILSPRAKKKLSLQDLQLVIKGGIGVIDCSWNKIDKIPFHKIHNGNERLLPFLVAANSTHYGRPYELSCAEAISACLYFFDFTHQAKKILGIFKGGSHFFELNSEAFSLYKKYGIDHQSMLDTEQEYIDKYTNLNRSKEYKDYDSLFSSSAEEESEY